MRLFHTLAASAAFLNTVIAVSLNDVCTSSYAVASLPTSNLPLGVTIDKSSVTASPVTNASVHGSVMYPDATFAYCNVTFAYSHNGLNDKVLVQYWLPAPSSFKNRYLATGGGGLAINSGSQSLPGGIIYGAAAGLTDGGFGSFNTQWDAVFLLANGTINWPSVYMMGYQAIHENTVIGQGLTKNFFNMTCDKLYSYYQGCSEGGREGFSQVQRFADQFDGAIIGAPALRYAHQQVQHLYSNVVEQTVGYYPPPCELQKIVNDTLAACDPLDGKVDGVVSRTDLCALHYNISSSLGKPYQCAAQSGGGFPPSPSAPAQNGTVTVQGIEVAQLILDGLHDSQGRQAYFSYQPAATFADAQTQYNNGSWGLYISGLGGEWVERYLNLLNASNVPDLDGYTYDTLVNYITEGLQRYQDSLQTTWPDLTPYKAAGGKILHYHGESDNSIPTASSVRYYESVRSIMYSNLSYTEGVAQLDDWYRLFLVPGAAHCNTNSLQPNGPFPQTNMAVIIDWVEKGIEPKTLNGTVLQGGYKGQNEQICSWPLRPLWNGNGTNPECVYDQASIDTWHYDLSAFKVPIY
ncbi:feruloyl esteras-like protein B precursor [Myriangium duriaei CBS 260.36]|uniref:Carboxylic ester hydrolase n=1 Tax=Myriangium duriaei CBS 260.36 TaxID=1168546 RepID=A0A9P4JD11_9PEZI|nr:feruloyl esteras-like protein B precursor [Myriangium duriaei CBS 260.36]